VKKALERTISKLSGDVTGLRGDVDECGLTSVERKAGVYVTDLVLETE